MVDEKIKQKEEELILMVSKFSDEYLDDEFKELNIKLVEKLGRKHDVPFKRGKLENWACGIVYAIGQLNFLFDDSINHYVTADDICDYFGCSKSTAGSKAKDIRKLFNLKLGNKEFSTELVISSDISNLSGDLTQIKTLEGAMIRSMLYDL